MDTELLDILEARCGLVCLVGAGGKKTTLYRLASVHPGKVGITTTVHIPPFPKSLSIHKVIADESGLHLSVTKAARKASKIAFAQPSAKLGRFAGLSPATVTQIHAAAGFDVTLVKADGARSRWIKAPGVGEPQLVPGVKTVIPVVSARAIGECLSDGVAHRSECVATLTGLETGEPITSAHVGRLLAHDMGALKDTAAAVVVPLINMVDDKKYEGLAREAAERALALSQKFDHVVLASMKQNNPLVAVIHR